MNSNNNSYCYLIDERLFWIKYSVGYFINNLREFLYIFYGNFIIYIFFFYVRGRR